MPTLLHEFFEQSARRHAEAIAVDVPPGPNRSGRCQISYSRMDEQITRLAARLRPHLDGECIVAILLPRTTPLFFVAQLAVLKAGAAFACLDPAFPDDHLRGVLDEAGAVLLLTDRAGLSRAATAGPFADRRFDVAEWLVPSATKPGGQLPASITPDRLAYVIHTSGSTGRPKGVMIEHRGIVNLVASDMDEFGLTPRDRVAQGSSAAYDSSIEETWLAFAAGATLVVMDDDAARLGPDLPAWLRRERISVLCPPPTLLRTTGCRDPRRELPDLRLLYVGGEALTEDLVERWAPGRRLVNGYGPTECTVTVVRGDVRPGRAVTIGKPVPGHQAWVLDESLEAVADGSEGELCIGGVGLARGYRHQPERTAEKFPRHPRFGRICRTGDLVRRDANGELVYLGRVDAQVKLRGYRVELGAIEAHLSRCPGVREAACCVQGVDGDQALAAHLVPADPNAPPCFDEIRTALRRGLPHYMVPSRFACAAELPRSVGGKLDRRRLPEIIGAAPAQRGNVVAPRDERERRIAAAFGAALKTGAAISMEDDFFVDLGGDSLSAVAVVCALRESGDGTGITVRALYEARTAARLAERLAAASPAPSPRRGAADRARETPPRVGIATTIQGLWLLIELALGSSAAYFVGFELLPALLERTGLLPAILLAPLLTSCAVLLYAPLALAIAAAVKWLLIGRYRQVRCRVWSGLYVRHWIVAQTARIVPWNALSGTVFYGAALRVLGAKIGRRVHVHRGVNLQRGGWDLLTIGDDVTLCQDASADLVELDDGHLLIAPVTIGCGATIDIRAGLSGGTVVEPQGHLAPLSWLAPGQRIPAGKRWDGVPAGPAGDAPMPPVMPGSRPWSPALHGLALIALRAVGRIAAWLPILLTLCLLSRVYGVDAARVSAWLYDASGTHAHIGLICAMPVAAVPVWLALKALALRCMGRVRPGAIGRWSAAYLRVWLKTGEVEAAGRWLSGTLFWPLWLRLAGMRIGRGCEISTIIDVVPERIEIGTGSFFADGIYLAGPRVHRGAVTIEDTRLGRGVFLGNHVVIPAGRQVPDDLFFGVCTVAEAGHERPCTSWFGHPAMELPRREVVRIDRRLTHQPGPLRYAARLFWETLRFALPVPPILVLFGWFKALDAAAAMTWPARWLLVAPAGTLTALGVLCLGVLALKWLLLARVRPGQHPLWSCWCSRWDFLYVTWQFLAFDALAALEGTLYLNWYHRAMGVHIGRRVVLGHGFAQVVDPDMLHFEDDTTINANFQAHSFEDRVLKIGPVHVRRGATLGHAAVVFFGADVGRDAWVAPHSVVMKNERLEAERSYAGCPDRPIG